MLSWYHGITTIFYIAYFLAYTLCWIVSVILIGFMINYMKNKPLGMQTSLDPASIDIGIGTLPMSSHAYGLFSIII